MSTKLNWKQLSDLPARTFICGYCGSGVASQKGFATSNGSSAGKHAYIYLCHKCARPNFFDVDGSQSPSAHFHSESAIHRKMVTLP
ncbi:MAG: hypothetical protein JO317_06975 [Verrucomicrobiae bacterium]|nr:hypothetical protein [Verrucomicrobiae bacterium]